MLPDCNIRVSRSTSCKDVAFLIASRILWTSSGDAVGTIKYKQQTKVNKNVKFMIDILFTL